MKVINRRAFHDYQVLGRYEVGIALTGPEVKMIRQGRIDLSEAFVRFVGYEPYLVNAFIPFYQEKNQPDYDPHRSRKLLLRKNEIESLLAQLGRKGLTIVPLSCYTTHNLVKLEVGLAQPKNQADKREALRRRTLTREAEQELANKNS